MAHLGHQNRIVAAAERGTLLVIGVLFATAGMVGTTTATLNGKTTNASSTVAAASVYAPASLTGSPSGHDASLTWPAGTNGNGYSVLGVANGSSSNCSSASFASVGTSASTSYTDSGRYTPQGTYFCYQVQTTYGGWSSQNSNPTAAVLLGFVPTAVSIANGGTSGKIDTGDTITITFNQAVNTGSGAPSGAVCGYKGTGAGATPGTNDTLWLGSSTTTNANCGSAESVSVGSLVGGTIGASNNRLNASYAWSNSNKTLTITLGTFIKGSPGDTMSAAAWTFHPTTVASNLLSSSGSVHICDSNAGGASCMPITASSGL